MNLEFKSEFLKEHGNELFPNDYSKEELIDEIKKFGGKGKVLRKNLGFFFKKIRWTGLYKLNPLKHPTPFERLNDNDKMNNIIDIIENTENKTFYNGLTLAQKVDKYFCFNCGVASQFDPKHVKVVNEYVRNYYDGIVPSDEKLNVLDPSMGWGARLMATMSLGDNYFGIDPNTNLKPYLESAGEFLQYNEFGTYDLKFLGSEIFIPEYRNKMHYAFTSPPYFDLEIYSNDDTQSVTQKGGNYSEWMNRYVIPTIDNLSKYMIDGGLVMINIKNIKKHNLYDDWFHEFMKHPNFELVEEIPLDWSRVKNTVKVNGSEYKEKIMVFKKVSY